jgi:hypothetical protein
VTTDAADSTDLSGPDRERLAQLRAARGLSDLVGLTDAEDEHGAYFAAKSEWYDLRGRELPAGRQEGLPGNTVEVDGQVFHVHGVTHADTDAEQEFLRQQVGDFLADGRSVYCEQGIRSMYFRDEPETCEMDDYRWAMAQCEDLDRDSHVDDLVRENFDGLAEDVDSLTDRFREATFSLINSGSDVYGERFRTALGDIASSLLTSHEGMATGEDFEAFTNTRAAATDPTKLVDLQHYYERRFLPQPVEREWLRRHDPELELVTHARNERMADYAVYHAETPEVHLVVGAAHQPGVTYYLKQYRDGNRQLGAFEPFG